MFVRNVIWMNFNLISEWELDISRVPVFFRKHKKKFWAEFIISHKISMKNKKKETCFRSRLYGIIKTENFIYIYNIFVLLLVLIK